MLTEPQSRGEREQKKTHCKSFLFQVPSIIHVFSQASYLRTKAKLASQKGLKKKGRKKSNTLEGESANILVPLRYLLLFLFLYSFPSLAGLLLQSSLLVQMSSTCGLCSPQLLEASLITPDDPLGQDRRTDQQTDRHTDRPTDRQTHRQTNRHTDRPTARQTHRQNSRQTKQTEGATDRWTDK